MQYFGIQEFLEGDWRLRLDMLDEGLTSAEEGSRVKLTEAGNHGAISSLPLPETCLWRAEMHGFNNSLHLGIIGRVMRISRSFDYEMSYGWVGQWVVEAGVNSSAEGWLGFRSGDLALFRLDMKKSRLQMAHKRLNKVFSIELPKERTKEQKTWHVHVNLSEAGTNIALSSLQPQHLTFPAYAWATTLGFGK